jgi:chitin synthase
MTPRQRHDSNTLLMLPAPLAINGRALTSSSSSVGVSRTSEENNTPDSAYTRVPATPQTPEVYADSNESGQRLLSPASPFEQQAGRSPPPRPISAYDSAAASRAQSISPFDNNVMYLTEQDDLPRVNRVQLTDNGPIPSDGVRRVPRSQARPGSMQNRYSRNSGVFSLPPGAAPPQPHGATS